jgi:hypothetical protein
MMLGIGKVINMKKPHHPRLFYLLIILSIVCSCNLPATGSFPINSSSQDIQPESPTITNSTQELQNSGVQVYVTSEVPVQSEPSVEITPTTPEDDSGKPVCINIDCLASGIAINYLIVTRPVFEEALEPFIAWKTKNGFRVGLVTVEWLDLTFEGRHMAERMKTGMHTIRKTSSSTDYLYVLLVGDTEIERDNYAVSAVQDSYTLDKAWNVPTGFYRRASNDPAGDVLPSDAYFVEDRDWDPDNTGLNPVPFQEYGQGTFDATIYLGRWSIRQTHELENIIAKTLTFKPVNKILIAQSTEFADYNACIWPPQDYNGTRAYGTCYLNMNETVSRLYGDNAPWLTTESLTIDTANPGEVASFYDTLLNYDAAAYISFHGYYNCIAIEENQCVGIDKLKFKSTIPFLELDACSVTAFYSGSEETLTESLHNLPSGPIIVSGAGHDNYHFFENLRAGDSVGKAFWRAGATYVYWPNPMLLLGDPSLPIFVSP